MEIDGEIVLYDDLSGRLHRLNSSAAVLWRCLDGRGSLADIATEIAETYQADPAEVLNDVVRATLQLAGEGLLAHAG